MKRLPACNQPCVNLWPNVTVVFNRLVVEQVYITSGPMPWLLLT